LTPFPFKKISATVYFFVIIAFLLFFLLTPY
jgi:hypothetical protein